MKIKPYEPSDLEAVLSSWESATRLAHQFMTEEFIAQERKKALYGFRGVDAVAVFPGVEVNHAGVKQQHDEISRPIGQCQMLRTGATTTLA